MKPRCKRLRNGSSVNKTVFRATSQSFKGPLKSDAAIIVLSSGEKATCSGTHFDRAGLGQARSHKCAGRGNGQ